MESEEQREAVCFRLGSALSPELGVGATAEGNAWPWPPSPSMKKKIPLWTSTSTTQTWPSGEPWEEPALLPTPRDM